MIDAESAIVVAQGLRGVMEAGDGASEEQRRVHAALCAHVLRVDPGATDALSPAQIATSLDGEVERQRFLHMAIVMELCRHPSSDEQRRLVDGYGTALGMGEPELEVVRVQAASHADDAAAYFVRTYRRYLPELSERRLREEAAQERGIDDESWAALRRLGDLDEGTLGWAYVEFHRRHGFELPGPDTPAPAYYVSHDMNHVIAGYEPTGPGEIALGVFKLAMNPSEANWMAAMVNLLIHETGMIKHGTNVQFVASGEAPYPTAAGGWGALEAPGAPDLVAEAFVRGAATTSDFSRADHLALAHLPLAEVRERYHVVPLAHSMMPFDDRALWPPPAS